MLAGVLRPGLEKAKGRELSPRKVETDEEIHSGGRAVARGAVGARCSWRAALRGATGKD